MNDGYIKLYRKLSENPYMKRPNYRAVWIELLLEAEHGMKKEGDRWRPKTPTEMKVVIWKGEKIHLKPGQLTCGLKQLSAWTGVSKSSCARILECFKNETMIETQASTEFSLITIKNWALYQMCETHSETQMGTPQECKNINTKKIYKRKKSSPEELHPVDKPRWERFAGTCARLGVNNLVDPVHFIEELWEFDKKTTGVGDAVDKCVYWCYENTAKSKGSISLMRIRNWLKNKIKFDSEAVLKKQTERQDNAHRDVRMKADYKGPVDIELDDPRLQENYHEELEEEIYNN